VPICPVCKTEWKDDVTECPVCSRELDQAEVEPGEGAWVLLGFISDSISADYAREVLKSYEIPAVVISKSGFLGQAGLTLPGFYKPGSQLFEVSAPEECVEEAIGILDMVLGDKWQRNEKES
jgi:hypothetical protein